jgi:hypothetical protein
MRLTTSFCKKKYVQNLLREKSARRGQGSMGCGATDDDDDVLTARSRVQVDKLTVAQLIMKFPNYN